MTANTTQTAAALNGHPSPDSRAPLVVTRGRRRPGLLLAGVALALVGALLGVWLVASAGDRTSVVVVARDVPQGATLTAEDLRVVDVSLDRAVGAFGADEVAGLVGQVAAGRLVAGSLLAPRQVGAAGPPGPGEVVVPLPLVPTRVPAGGLVGGERLLVVDTPSEQADPPSGEAATFEVTVVRVGAPDLNGVVVVDVLAASDDGPALAARAATGRFALVILPASEAP